MNMYSLRCINEELYNKLYEQGLIPGSKITGAGNKPKEEKVQQIKQNNLDLLEQKWISFDSKFKFK